MGWDKSWKVGRMGESHDSGVEPCALLILSGDRCHLVIEMQSRRDRERSEDGSFEKGGPRKQDCWYCRTRWYIPDLPLLLSLGRSAGTEMKKSIAQLGTELAMMPSRRSRDSRDHNWSLWNF